MRGIINRTNHGSFLSFFLGTLGVRVSRSAAMANTGGYFVRIGLGIVLSRKSHVCINSIKFRWSKAQTNQTHHRKHCISGQSIHHNAPPQDCTSRWHHSHNNDSTTSQSQQVPHNLLSLVNPLTNTVLLGDSITEITCWRPQVWTQLASANLSSSVDLVGTQSNIPSNCQRPSGFDTNHEGHSGYQAYDVARNNIAGWVRDTKPDVVQFMLGTNDVNIGKRNAQSILDSYTSLVGTMRSANPKVKILVSGWSRVQS